MRQILHISDIHFGPHHAPEVAKDVLALLERRRPDMVVISGDLTQRAKPEQFRQAREFVDQIDVPTLVVPGNHDVPMYRVWERVLSPYGAYRKHFAQDLEPVHEDDDLLVVGINTAFNWTIKDGRMLRSRLREVESLLAAAGDKTKIIVAHHELIPAPRFDTQRVLAGARNAVEVFARQGVDMVLSGHLHQAYVMPSEAFYPSADLPFLVVHSGTTTSHRGRGCERRRYSCNWINIDDDELTISHLRWNEDSRHFDVRSRHHFPRRDRPRRDRPKRDRRPYGLETL